MSHFVAAGGDSSVASDTKDDAWAKAREAIEATKKPKPDVGKQDDGKSLYDVLQANKAAKQAEFEESVRLKNQFRTLDDDEVDFLDNVLQTERAKEAEVRKENAEQLEAFRVQQEKSQRTVLDTTTGTQPGTDASPDTQEWTTKKRRRKETNGGAAKIRKTSTSAPQKPILTDETPASEAPLLNSPPNDEATSETVTQNTSVPAAALGLGAYSSDED